jgi:lipoprotein-anchoring transpeptidase ErfK/SrfK
VAPADRFWQAAAPEFHGQELDGEKFKLPVAWVYGLRKTDTTYEIDTENNKIVPKGSVKKFEPIQLAGESLEFRGKTYQKLADGTFIRDDHVRITTPEKRPDGVGDHERWVDVDISEQTVVVFEGDTAIYATLTSSGKESKIKDKDHSTPRGMWRVREKHLVTTMDGNGTAAGDLPYSIEDVPYVMYFHKAYALHGAFWHQNFGSQMSHGCVNLAPLDAKWVFFHTAPFLPEGLSGVWSRDERPGSMVVVHD